MIPSLEGQRAWVRERARIAACHAADAQPLAAEAIAARLAEATSAGRAIEGPVKSQRWLELCRALMNSAIAYHDRLDRDTSLLRSLLAAATGIAEAEQPGFTLGSIYGSLTIDEARTED